MRGDFYRRVYDVVRMIPAGRVATYGQIAAMLGSPQAARTVGYALNALKANNVSPPVPWQRVINYRGGISLPPGGGFEIQKHLLAEEGVYPEQESGLYDLSKYLWEG